MNHRHARLTRAAYILFMLVTMLPSLAVARETWRGLVVTPEHRCTPYRQSDYRYPPSVEPLIVAELGGLYSPYTGERFASLRESDIEHLIARSEAHDSGLCAASLATRRRFSADLINLTLASPTLNRHHKRGHDAAAWLPPLNRCWFAERAVQVRRKYALTIDRREAAALEAVLSSCVSSALIMTGTREPGTASPNAEATPPPSTGDYPSDVNALRLWDDNRNGRITCKEARRHGIAPVPRGHPAYRFMRDGDGDGVVCE